MKKFSVLLLVLLMVFCARVPQAYAAGQTFSFAGGSQSFVVPAGVTSITVDASGAMGATGGGNSPPIGGAGGRVQTTLTTTPGETLTITVGGMNTTGGGGGGGGGDGNGRNGGNGGGATIIIRGGNNVIIAGGGGGGGGDWVQGDNNVGGTGGAGGQNGSAGQDGIGINNTHQGTGGGGGTGSAGGAAGTCNVVGHNGSAGSLGSGGTGGNGSGFGGGAGGGGGGGGYYGGGGGGCGNNMPGGGGGGSSLAGTGTSSTTFTSGYNSTDGQVIISVPATITSPTKASITSIGATLGGNVTDAGNTSITGRGVCVGTSANPALGGTCFSTSGTTGVFTVAATSLNTNTAYHYRAYATNAVGTSYTSDDTFSTPVLLTTTVAATTISGIGTALKGLVSPNGLTTTAWFRYSASNPGTCDDSFGTRIPSISSSDAALGSGNTPIAYARNLSTFTSGTTYYYCAISNNSGGTSFGSILSVVATGGGGCGSVPTTGNYTASSSCIFPNHLFDGVDSGSGTTNTAQITIGAGKTLTVGSNQTIVYGIISKPGASIIKFSGGVLKKGALWIPDTDGDGYPDAASVNGQQFSTTQPANYARRHTATTLGADCSSGDATKWANAAYYRDEDIDGVYKGTTVSVCAGSGAPSGYSASQGTDCNDADADIYQNINVATDADQEGYSTSTASSQCVGVNSTVSGRTYYKDSSGAYTKIAAASIIGTNDCYDGNVNAKPGQTSYFGSQRGDGSYDYDCSGAPVLDPSQTAITQWRVAITGCHTYQYPSNPGCFSEATSTGQSYITPSTALCGAFIYTCSNKGGLYGPHCSLDICGGTYSNGQHYSDSSCSNLLSDGGGKCYWPGYCTAAGGTVTSFNAGCN